MTSPVCLRTQHPVLYSMVLCSLTYPFLLHRSTGCVQERHNLALLEHLEGLEMWPENTQINKCQEEKVVPNTDLGSGLASKV